MVPAPGAGSKCVPERSRERSISGGPIADAEVARQDDGESLGERGLGQPVEQQRIVQGGAEHGVVGSNGVHDERAAGSIDLEAHDEVVGQRRRERELVDRSRREHDEPTAREREPGAIASQQRGSSLLRRFHDDGHVGLRARDRGDRRRIEATASIGERDGRDSHGIDRRRRGLRGARAEDRHPPERCNRDRDDERGDLSVIDRGDHQAQNALRPRLPEGPGRPAGPAGPDRGPGTTPRERRTRAASTRAS